VVHVAINFFIIPITENHVEIFREASHFMGTNPVIKVMEYVLFLGFIIHIIYGLILQIQNWMARPVRYKKEGWSHTSFFSKFMIHTGVVIGIFLVLHFMDFYFVKLGWMDAPQGPARVTDPHDFYAMAINLFSNKTYSIIYIVLLLIMGFHLNHALQSAFQSIGLEHTKYTPFIKAVGDLYSIFITMGFIAIPLYFIVYY